MQSVKPTKISGTREWSVCSVNCVTGCSHDCRYCYAKARAIRFRQIASADDWRTPVVRQHDVRKSRKLEKGRVMFPSTHDIVPETLGPCMEVLAKLLRAGNDVLIVSKPHLHCIKAICEQFRMYREAIMFRFSIGAMSDTILKCWEPGAPEFGERLASLQYASRQGYATSVSCEPLLDVDGVRELFDAVNPYVSDSVWIGKMNRIGARVAGVPQNEITRIQAGQTPTAIRRAYDLLDMEPHIRWKESYKEVLGLTLSETAGLDV